MQGEQRPVPVVLHRRIAGREGRSIVLIHGWCCAGPYWDAVTPLLSATYQTVAIDLRGFGRSPKPLSGYRFAHHETDLLALVQELNLRRFALVGHSLGGAFAIHFALAHPEVLSCVTIVDSGASTRGNLFIEGFAQHVLERGLTGAELAAAVRKWFVELTDERLAYYTDLAAQSTPQAMGEALLGLMERDMADELHTVRVPALVLYGEHDRNRSLAEAQALRDGLPDAELHVFSGVAHCPHVEAPREFVDVLTGFLKRRGRWD